MDVGASVVDVDVPLLLGLDLFEKLRIVLDFGKFTMSSTSANWSVPLTMKIGHADLVWQDSIFYTETELRKIHCHLHHPSTDKMFAVIRKEEPTKKGSGTYKVLDKVRSTCDVCQRNADEPHRFRVSLPANSYVFNRLRRSTTWSTEKESKRIISMDTRLVSMDIISLDSCSVLHVAYSDTKFGAACFRKGVSASAVWQAFLDIWVTTYIGYSDIFAIYQGPQYVSHELQVLLQGAGIQIHKSGVESDNALGNGEKYHAYFRNVYSKIRDDESGLKK